MLLLKDLQSTIEETPGVVNHLPISTLLSYPSCTIREYYYSIRKCTAFTFDWIPNQYKLISSLASTFPQLMLTQGVKDQMKEQCRKLPVILHLKIQEWMQVSNSILINNFPCHSWGWDWICSKCHERVSTGTLLCPHCKYKGEVYNRQHLLDTLVEGCYSFRLFGQLLEPHQYYWLPLSPMATPLSQLIPFRCPLINTCKDQRSIWYFIIAWQFLHTCSKPILHVNSHLYLHQCQLDSMSCFF